MPTSSHWLNDEQTPFLLIDEVRFVRNVGRLATRINQLGCQLRPHLKTLRSVDAAKYILPNFHAPATVSTLAEAEAFAQAGCTDLLYAVGIVPAKLARVAELIRSGVKLHILLDTQAQAQAVIDYQKHHKVPFSVFIEIDCDDHRGGLAPQDQQILAIAQMLHDNQVKLTGLMTHSGGSYSAQNSNDIRQAAAQECQAVKVAAQQLKAHGLACPVLSVGSTPTAHFAEDLQGITEVRAGVYTTFDLVMYNLGVCQLNDIAMSVVTSVIGHNAAKNWLLIDAGWMALSRDRGTAKQHCDFGYGLVCDNIGQPLSGCHVTQVNQEHGVIELPDHISSSQFPIGTQLRVLPNHACATAAMHQSYTVLKADGSKAVWPRILGW